MNKYNYIALTQKAVSKIISDRKLQCSDFDESDELVDVFFFNNKLSHSYLDSIIRRHEVQGGLIICDIGEEYSSQKNTITIDMNARSIIPPSGFGCLTILLKLFRFCIRYWNRYALNNNEYTPANSTKAIIFPYPMTSSNSFRITVEREPNKKRLESRFPGMHLLAYKFGSHEGDGLKEEAPLQNFNKAIAGLFDRQTYKHSSVNIKAEIPNTIETLSLVDERINYLSPTNWQNSLTSKQSAFVNSSIDSTSRIEGPAGSGKTLCLILKCIKGLDGKYVDVISHKSLFIVPSNEVAGQVKSLFDIYSERNYFDKSNSCAYIEIKTLQDICRSVLGSDVSDNDFLDLDTYEAKNTQLLHLAEIIEDKKKKIKSYEGLISRELYELVKDEDCLKVAELLMHEISVVIKGRCNESLDLYKQSIRPKYGLPISGIEDREFVFSLFNSYKAILDDLVVYDVDDIVISSIGKLDAPIWRRRRKSEGYDSIFIDEVHLFSFNELSMVHYLTKELGSVPLSYSIDVSQALGDIAWSDSEFYTSIQAQSDQETTTLKTIFRCSPEIAALAYSINSSGVCLFTNFKNLITTESFVELSNRSNEKPEYIMIKQESELLMDAISKGDSIVSLNKGVQRSDVAFICMDHFILSNLNNKLHELNKNYVCMSKRGDFDSLKEAKEKNGFVVMMADHAGGLEFEAVIIIGVDKGRVPQESYITNVASRQYALYVAHNRMYVAVTRAKQLVYIYGEHVRGTSEVLKSAILSKTISVLEL